MQIILDNMTNGMALGGFAGLAVIIADVIVTGASSVNLREAIVVASVVCSAGWWLSAKFTRIDSRLDQVDKKLSDIENKK